jgi:DNA-binding NarL/FixJ family response regulator
MLAPPPERLPDPTSAAAGGARPLRALLADPNPRARRAVAAVLGDVDGVVLVGQVDSWGDVADSLHREQVDVLVVDDGLLAHDGQARGRVPQGLRVIVLGVDDDPTFAARARSLGAEAWIAKDAADEGLHEVLGAGHGPAGRPA